MYVYSVKVVALCANNGTQLECHWRPVLFLAFYFGLNFFFHDSQSAYRNVLYELRSSLGVWCTLRRRLCSVVKTTLRDDSTNASGSLIVCQSPDFVDFVFGINSTKNVSRFLNVFKLVLKR